MDINYGEWTIGPDGFIVQPYFIENSKTITAVSLLIFDEKARGGPIAASLITEPRNPQAFLEQAEKNALLISAAPNLLAACQEAIGELSENSAVRKRMKNAIAKAVGESFG